MPELPEVETLCRQLKNVILDKEIRSFEILDSKLTAGEELEGRRVLSVGRQGKVLEIKLDAGITMLLHLRLTGRLLWQSDSNLPFPHTRFTIFFLQGRLDCIDPRRFATLSVQKTIGTNFAAPVIDPLKDFCASRLWEMARRRKVPVKSFLMDQRFIAGIGNIYASEILYEAFVNPWQKTDSLSPAKWQEIEEATTSILKRAIACRGTTVSDWRDLFGRKGEYQHYLKVYAREGCPCPRCQATIQCIHLHGRGTYFCPTCQKPEW
ncbi:MAG: bifunctional DNA-formamidopyrimidine glycosylase/DNA-(apurinic or apyrimidinic site) lyase [Syntrophales bacterium]|nr:bifunctional DNA-formamidopyrimidine glycosylase/DNA-(apurinic or apyrimidinic site) lyase [Syntrophales bacterium]